MTVEVKAETMQVVEAPVKVVEVEAEKGVGEVECEKDESKAKMVEKSSSYREESNFLSDLKEHEKKALNELKTKLEETILGNTLFKKEDNKEAPKKSCNEGEKKEEEKPKEECEKEADKKEEKCEEEKKSEEKPDECEKPQETEGKEQEVEVDKDISIWGVPLLPSKGHEGTTVVLLKFLRAREFKVNDAFEMLKKTLQWRKDFKIDSILDEEFETDLSSAAYMSGIDRQGHPICYNIFGVLDNQEIYEKTLATEEKREQFLRWRVQLMEKGVQKLDFKPGGINSIVQINDLKNSPGPSKKDVRAAVNKAVSLLQDNYPEFAAKNIFINVPFWYFAFHSLLSPFLTQRTRSKLVFVRPSKVTETLLKYIPIQEIPIKYGGIKRENDFEFSASDGEVTEVVIKAGSTETIEIPTPEAGTTFIWDIIVLGWEVNYTEEFVPTDENSYTMIIHKEKKMRSDEEPVRRTFKNQAQGRIVLTVQNCSGKKKKLFYRYKVKKACF
ncbi:Phosphatidylinositol transfer protein SEC14 [Handroanthus impetiginosus]|uniref:Phosphatidylinositol transfer protein SEC14 n=1 Tax=Handroanthus impetiginosus TaxID=429701 RepID=A0A2G9FY33_9LAMI|nr:Phosphatidylinositol transfer protein SEC14 [Handroanthus impetiginosus]